MLKGRLANHLGRSKGPSEAMIIRTLDMISEHVGEEFTISWSTSKRGIPNLRIDGLIGNQSWIVSIYSDDYFFSRVGSVYDVFDTPGRVINFVRARLKNLQAI